MKTLLIHSLYQSQLVEAIETLYEQWKIDEEKRRKEERERGWVTVYSQWHLVYESPISAIRNAEKVGFTDGILGPPTSGEIFFLLDERFSLDTPRMLERGGFKSLGDVMTNAVRVQIPERHLFTDPTGEEYAVIGWNQEDALQRIEKEEWIPKPLEWFGADMWMFPCSGVERTGHNRIKEEEEMYQSEGWEYVEPEKQEPYFIPFDERDEIPF